ncbi:MAG: Hsp20/alpha crystallin family protein [Dehalococcoidia bacterium]
MTNEEEAKTEETPKPAETPKTRAVSFPDIREEMDRLWAAVMQNPWRPFRMTEPAGLLPSMDVFEKDGKVEVKIELPGIAAKDVDIAIDEGVLTVTGEKKGETEVNEGNYHRSERTYGKFSRQVSLPAHADADKATAKFTDGVLEISIPTKEVTPPTAKKIEITGA